MLYARPFLSLCKKCFSTTRPVAVTYAYSTKCVILMKAHQQWKLNTSRNIEALLLAH